MTSLLRSILGQCVLVADGAMGTMLQSFDLSLDDFEGAEGCNEILNRTRPEVIASIHRTYLDAGADLIETNTFGANLSALGEYDISDQIASLAGRGAAIARKVADEFTTVEHPRFVLGSVGPGTKLPSLGQIEFSTLRDAYQTQVAAMVDQGIDGVQIETCQDLLQTKAAVIGARRALTAVGVELPIFVSITVETTGVMLLGSEIGAALSVLEALGVDAIGLNCATGPSEMGEHLRFLARHAQVALSAMPNAGLPELSAEGAKYPLSPSTMASAIDEFVERYGLSLVGGCCGTTPEHIRQVARLVGHRPVKKRVSERLDCVASLYSEVSLSQDASYLTIGERTNANGSKIFREAMLAGDWDECVRIAKQQSRDGAHLTDLCVDYVGRDGTSDLKELASRIATNVTLPVVVDSTEPKVIQAGLEHLPGRSIVNSVNYEDGCGPDSRFQRVMRLVVEHGAAVIALTIDESGQARSAEAKVRVASRLIDDLVGNWGMRMGDILVDCLTFPVATGQEETRKDALETINAIRELKKRYPQVRTTLGVSNVSFGLNPAARVVLNSIFLDECVKVGLDSAIVNAAKIMPVDRIQPDQAQAALDLIYDRRRADYDPLMRLIELFEGVTAASMRSERDAELASLPVLERLSQRIIDGNDKDMNLDLDEAMTLKSPLELINDDLLRGMKTVGELFGAGKMQLPFVLASAEVMKRAVTYLEPHLESFTSGQGKGTIVLATVKGDVHDVGKNLVDIIVTNNGYKVVNLGIKQPISAIIAAAEEHNADAIGLSGLLVKSTLVMKDDLLELNDRGLASKYPVILGGAALTRDYVDHDLAELYDGSVAYAKDAFEGLALLDTLLAIKHGDENAALPQLRPSKSTRRNNLAALATPDGSQRSDVERLLEVPIPPFWGTRVHKGIKLAEVLDWLDERALFAGRWGLKSVRDGASYAELVEQYGRPQLRTLLERIQTAGLAQFGVVYGYFPVYSVGNELIVVHPDDADASVDEAHEVTRFTFPRQNRDRQLCLADFFRDELEARERGFDVLAMQLVSVGELVEREALAQLAEDAYRDYFELDGLSAQLGEALAESWHRRIREELGILGDEQDKAAATKGQAYRGSRYSFGYPAIPNLEDRAKIVQLLDAGRIGVQLSEGFQLQPEHSTDALIVHHPQAKYFSAD